MVGREAGRRSLGSVTFIDAITRRWPFEVLPTSYVIDRDGIVRYVHEGFGDTSGATIAAEVEALLARPAAVE